VRLKAVFAASERLTEPQRRRLQETFRCRIYSWYGHAERVVLAGQGRRSDLFYFWPTYGYAEFSEPDADGLSEVIGTSFHNLVMPLIRYRSGDLVRPYDAARDGPREFLWTTAQSVEGRKQEFLVTSTGRRISLTAFNMHDTSFDGLYALQFFQDRPGFAEFRYVAGPHFDSARLPRIEASIKRKLGDDFDVVTKQVTDVEKAPSGKSKWLVSALEAASPDDASLEET
jgi:phenylacetate-CoA ligase